ncbi:MAG: sensor histidine kinase [Chloroflexota bacterium]|nr:sensor histidine kinase [Chloroflexota bacterium]
MDGTRVGDARDGRFDELHAEAKAALAYAANSLDAVAGRYRGGYLEELGRYQALRDELDTLERRPRREWLAEADARPEPGGATATEAPDDDARLSALRSDVERLEIDVGAHQAELARFELAHRSLESTWLFLERGDASLIPESHGADRQHDIDMRIVEAQEAERSRLAQEIHDGPAQALSNAIFQVEYIERVMDEDPRLARTELRFMRELLRRELGDVRTFISQLRPPLLDELGLDGSIIDAAETMAALADSTVETDLQAPSAQLGDAQQTVVLRVVQEALQNVRKHAKATRTTIVSRIEAGAWSVEIRDDGLGFDVGAAASRSRRNFGLQFMRERAELIGAALEVSSRPDAGTVVRLVVPLEKEST